METKSKVLLSFRNIEELIEVIPLFPTKLLT